MTKDRLRYSHLPPGLSLCEVVAAARELRRPNESAAAAIERAYAHLTDRVFEIVVTGKVVLKEAQVAVDVYCGLSVEALAHGIAQEFTVGSLLSDWNIEDGFKATLNGVEIPFAEARRG